MKTGLQMSCRSLAGWLCLLAGTASCTDLSEPDENLGQVTQSLTQSITYVGKQSITDFTGLGQHLQYWPLFGRASGETARRTDDADCIELTPDFANFKHHYLFDGRTFSNDALGDPIGTKTRGGYSNWAVFKLPDGRTGRSGTFYDESNVDNANNTVNEMRINVSSLHEFCLNLITDNTGGEHDPDVRLEARSDDVNLSLAGHPDFVFDGQADMYTFLYQGMKEDDVIKIRFQCSSSSGCRGAGLGGMMVSHVSTCTTGNSGPDAGPRDAAVSDAGANGLGEDDEQGRGCGCRSSDSQGSGSGLVSLLLLLATLAARRGKRATSSCNAMTFLFASWSLLACGRANNNPDAGADFNDAGDPSTLDAGAPGSDGGDPALDGCGTHAQYVVDGATGSDSYAGTASAPWATIQKAAATLVAGDQVTIRPATYHQDVYVANSGANGAPICFFAQSGAILDHASFYANGKSYIVVDGLRVQASNAGIRVQGPGQHIAIRNNVIHDAYGSCIGVWGSPGGTNPASPAVCPAGPFKCMQNVSITGNTLELCNNGGANENLTVAQGVDQFEIRGNTLRDGTDGVRGGEGIDLKEGVSNGVVAGNQILFPARDPGIYLDGGGFWAENPTPRNHHIVITGNRVSGVGIRLDSEHQGTIDHVTISNNVVTGAPHDGIVIYQYPDGSTAMDSITIVNNTTSGNSLANPWWYGISLAHPSATNVVIRNNLCWGEMGAGALNVGQSINDHNLSSDPRFVNAAAGDFHLQPGSPALNTGSPVGAPMVDYDGTARSTTAPSVGAFEH